MSEEEEVVVKSFSQNCINQYMQCSLCIEELPPGVSPDQYQRISVGFTDKGMQIWCSRHKVNILHMDFEGAVHKASSRIDPEDFRLAQERMKMVVDSDINIDVVTWGLAVAKYRMKHYAGTPLMVLRTFTEELNAFLMGADLSEEWATAGRQIEDNKLTLIVPGR
jgi:hypothetical protein